ncbi:hypothetical protein P3T21_001036 [Paraburkholderia sp. GAS334]
MAVWKVYCSYQDLAGTKRHNLRGSTRPFEYSFYNDLSLSRVDRYWRI